MEQQTTNQQQEQANNIITIVLTADNHLGYTVASQHPRKREQLRQRLRRAFQQATDFAIGQGVDLFVQAGDLFDTPTPGEKDRSFVAARLAQLRQVGIRTFALGGAHDTPQGILSSPHAAPDAAPQDTFARLGALHYFAPVPNSLELEPIFIKIRNLLVGICGLGVLGGQEGNPLARICVQHDIERADISLLILHAPIEGLVTGSAWLDTHAQVSRNSIEQQTAFHYILAGYHHTYRHLRTGQCDVIVAGATQHIDFRNTPGDVGALSEVYGARFNPFAPNAAPGFVFLGLAADGIRWCNHIPVDALKLHRLVIHTNELWSSATGSTNAEPPNPTDTLIDRLRPFCGEDAIVQLRLTGQLTHSQYHQLDLHRVHRYGEEHCFDLSIDDTSLEILPGDYLPPTPGIPVPQTGFPQEVPLPWTTVGAPLAGALGW